MAVKAFPTPVQTGMDLRDWFAGMVIESMMPINVMDNDWYIEKAAEDAYRVADAMMEARKNELD